MGTVEEKAYQGGIVRDFEWLLSNAVMEVNRQYVGEQGATHPTRNPSAMTGMLAGTCSTICLSSRGSSCTGSYCGVGEQKVSTLCTE